MFYVLLAAVPLTAIGGLLLLARAVDAATGATPSRLGRAQAIAAAVVLALLVIAAAASSPLT